MAKKVHNIPRDNNILRIPLEEAMPDNYLPYAVEVAKDRALPDVRDGLKPVHRRILYGAYLLKAFPDRPYYKSARIVGDVLGKFHPHGDTSVYDAMVLMAQNFSTRETLFDGHGNFGSMDGDGAAAMRYTEARLSPIAVEMLRDIDKETVEMVPNYSDSEMEPKVLPARYPNLLVNGTFGIAVGLATNIPPHNLGEVTDGVLAYIDNPKITTQELMEYIKAPDLPTGGVLIGKKSLLSAYETGEGKVTLRAKTAIEKLENGRYGIVITEFPYRRNKSKILQTISEMTGDKKHQKALEAITDIRDESDRSGIRAVVELKKAADYETADKILKYLFKKTDLQCNISFNMVALANGKPQTMGLKTIIEHYVNHQRDVVTKRSIRELAMAEKRFHIVEGFIKAIDVLDEIIKTIRESKSKKDAGVNLVEKFGFTETQAEAILELMLYRLTGLEIKVFQKEYTELEKTIKKLRKILSHDKTLLEVIKTELKEITDKYRNPRRTMLVEDDSEAKIDLQELIVVEDVMVTLSKDGFIKRIPLKTYQRSNAKAEDIDYREGDELKFLFKSNTTENILLFTDRGNMYQVKGINIPEGKWKEKGERIDSIIKTLNLDEEGCYESPIYTSKSKEVIAAKDTADKYVKAKITFNVNGNSENIDGNMISQWIVVGEDFNVSLNEDAIREYTNQLGDKYDNIGETRTVTRWSGEQIKISTTPGIYYVDRNTTISEIEDAIKSGKSVTKDLTFKTPTATDEYVLNTFVEVDLTNQTVIYYKNGEVITQGNVVTGNVSQGHATPAGVYKLDWKAKDYVLRGQGYASPVNFWMPFNGGIGLHDASWRSQFGGSIYKTNGSHGCVNMTYSVAKAIYDNIEEHTTIICKY